jgi:hypothetical protein
MHQRDHMANSDHIFKFWGPIDTVEDAIKASKNGMVAAYICAAVTSGIVVAGLLGFRLFAGVGALALIDAAIFVGLGWGISKYSRISAGVALGFYLLEQANNAMNLHAFNAVMALIFIVLFIKGLRGTLAYHRLNRLAVSNNSDA